MPKFSVSFTDEQLERIHEAAAARTFPDSASFIRHAVMNELHAVGISRELNAIYLQIDCLAKALFLRTPEPLGEDKAALKAQAYRAIDEFRTGLATAIAYGNHKTTNKGQGSSVSYLSEKILGAAGQAAAAEGVSLGAHHQEGGEDT